MLKLYSNAIIFFAVFSWEWGLISAEDVAADRTQKHFSLFSVVTFKNEECTSLSTITGSEARKGTCYTTTECTDKSGLTSGNCASGFGVCCVFINNAAVSATISENRTLLRNAEYPSYTTATASTTIAYTINKMNADICQIRLDFEDFIIAGPANSGESIGGTTTTTHCTNDYFTLLPTSSTGLWPTMCGAMHNEHLYVELGTASTDTVVATIVTGTTPVPATAKRLWDIQVTQIPCYANYRAPHGCQRYFMSDYGKIISLNFYKVSGSTPAANAQNSGIELSNQNLNTCIRQSKGMCCVEYQTCVIYNSIELVNEGATADGGDNGINGQFTEAWSIDTGTFPYITPASDNSGLVDAQCSNDYVGIPSSWSGPCGGGSSATQGMVNSRYCGAHLGANWPSNGVNGAVDIEDGPVDVPVCDCSQPFMVTHRSDIANDDGEPNDEIAAVNANTGTAPRGFCLDFRQSPCWK